MNDHEINAVVCVDTRNPLDRFEFSLFGLVVPSERMILYVFKMYTGEANWRFQRIANARQLTIAIIADTPSEATVLHRLLSLWRSGQSISEFRLNAISPRIHHPYASLKMADVKVTSVARKQGESSGGMYYFVSLAAAANSVSVSN